MISALAAIVPWVLKLFKGAKKTVKTVRKNPWMVWAAAVVVVLLIAMFVWWRIAAMQDAQSVREVELMKKLADSKTQRHALKVDRDKHRMAYENAAESSKRWKSVAQRTNKSKERWKSIAKDGTVIEYEREVEVNDTRTGEREDSAKTPILPAPTEIPGVQPEPSKVSQNSWLLAGDYAVRQEMWAGTVYKIWRPWLATGAGVGGPDIAGTVSAHVMISRFGASYAFSVPLEHKVRATVSF